MSILLFALVGGFVGWLVAAIKEVEAGIFAHMGIGIVGALLGAFAATLCSSTSPMTQFTWLGILFSIAGALALLGIMNISNDYDSSDNRIRSK